MKPKIHLYTICWNEEKFLEFFFNYYDSIVDEYHFYDDESNDATLQILAAHPKVNIHRFETTKNSYVKSAKNLHESHWKNSIGRADWVIITAVDEFLYHPNLIRYLQVCTEKRITAIPAIGFQMISDSYPKSGMLLTSQITTGAYFQKMNKLSIFNPNEVTVTNYGIGRHKANPEGNINYPKKDVLLNLHFKYLSIEFTFARHQELNEKLRSFDKQKKWGHRYNWNMKQLKEDWETFQLNAIDDVFNTEKLEYYLNKQEIIKWWKM